MTYFVFSEYSYMEMVEPAHKYEHWGMILDAAPKYERRTGIIREAVDILPMPKCASDINEWIREYEEKKGKELVEIDIEKRNDAWVTVKNMSRLT